MRKLLISATLAALLSAATANAATYNVGDLTALGSDGYTDGISFAPGSFSDTFNFDITGGINDFSGLLTKLSLKPSQLLTSFSGLLTGPGSFSQSLAYGVGSLGGTTLQGLGWDGQLASGSYSLLINGSAARSGSYTVQLQAAPVPEPESYALMLAGLGVMGAVARRRMQKKQ